MSTAARMVLPAPGILLAHKPRGATSFSLVRAVQDALRDAQAEPLPVCHGGALDPFAEGLLLLLVGPATRLMEELHPIPKYYEAELSWGAETDTCDAGGRPVFTGDARALTAALLEEKLAAQQGWQEQVPPATSNKRVEGERAWKRAHRGEQVLLPPSRVYLHEARFLAHDLPRSSRLSLSCRGGYYVRALARDLGRALGCGAHLTSLSRTHIGPWSDPGPALSAAASASRGTEASELPNLQLSKLPICGPDLLPWLPSRLLTEQEASAVELRRAIPRGEIVPAPFALPSGFPGPGADARDRTAPIRGLCDGKLRVLLRERGADLALHTDLDGGV